jgi:hypothetical protein
VTASKNFKAALAGFACVLALSANAQAVTLDAGVFAVGNGDAANPIVLSVLDPGNPGGSGLFLDTINFDLGSFTHFNMTSTVNGITFFGAPIFENVGDTEVVPASSTHFDVLLANLNLPRDYHLHPQGVGATNANYTLTMWGSFGAPVPVPAAVYLFGAGLIGLAGLARRRVSARA